MSGLKSLKKVTQPPLTSYIGLVYLWSKVEMKYFISGYIEGYYGKSLNWDERGRLIGNLHKEGLNTYLYAPKADVYHRAEWKKPYPDSWVKEFRRLVRTCRKLEVQFIPAIAPGLSFNYRSETDYQLLLKKMVRFYGLGVSTVALLMDDIDKSLPPNCKNFQSLGEVHGRLLFRLSKDICKKGRNRSLWFCPTEYCNSLAGGHIKSSAYLNHLAFTAPSDIIYLWTGLNIVSEKLEVKNLSPLSKLFGENVVLWDNFYANDYCPRKIILGPYTGRAKAIQNLVKGVMLNPTGYFHTDLLYLQLLRKWISGGSTIKSWRAIYLSLGLPVKFIPLLIYFGSPYKNQFAKALSQKELVAQLEIVEEVIFTWKSPLLNEWFAFLQGLRHDLRFRITSSTDREKKKLLLNYPDSLQGLLENGGQPKGKIPISRKNRSDSRSANV